MRKRHVILAAATVSVASLGMARQAFATAYASQVTLSGSTVSFDLNESTQSESINTSAGDVTLLITNGSSVTTQDLGALPAGLQTITLGSTPSLVQVKVTTNDQPGFLAANSVTDAGGPGSAALEIDQENESGNPVLFGSPRGDAVDTNPADKTFGTVYVTNNASHGGNLPQQGVYALNADLSFLGAPSGGFAGTNEQAATTISAANAVSNIGGTAGLTFSGAGPTTVQVGSDGYLYIGNGITTSSDSDVSPGPGLPLPGVVNNATDSIYRGQLSATTGLVAGSGTNVLTGIGISNLTSVTNQDGVANSVPTLFPNENHADNGSNVFITGSSAAGNLNVYAIDASFGSAGATVAAQLNYNQFYDWQVGNDAPSTNGTGADVAPTKLTNSSAYGLDTRFWNPQPSTTDSWFNIYQGVIDDLTRGGPANQFYVTQSRSGGGQPDLFLLSPTDNSTVVWTSLDQTERQGLSTNADFLLGAYDETISPDGRFLAIGQSSSADVYFGAYLMPVLAGVPDVRLTQVFDLNVGGTDVGGENYIRGIAFDAADNVYATNSGLASLGVFAPGGTSTTITGSNGTFTNAGQWTGSSSGSLSSTSNWLGSSLPNGNDQALTFGTVASGHYTVSVDGGETVGAVSFTSSTGYTLSAGGGSITIAGSGGNISAQAGNHTIAAPVTVNTDLGLYAAAGASVTISGKITYGSVSYVNGNLQLVTGTPDVVKAGAGTVSVSSLNLVQNNLGDATSGNLDIYAGKLALLPSVTAGSNPAVISELTLDTGASLDLGNNDLIYDYNLNTYTTKSPLLVVQGLVASGAIMTSTGGLAKGTGLAVVENDSAYLASPFSNYDGQNLNPENSSGGTVIVKYTYFGDLNLDGKVDGADFTQFNSGQYSGWANGDLNYDGVVNADDVSLFQLGAAMYGASQVQLPEPGSLALIGLAALPMIRRRRA